MTPNGEGLAVLGGQTDLGTAWKPEGNSQPWYREKQMTATATIVLSIIGTGIGIVGIVGLMVRMLATRIDGITTRVDSLAAETNRRFDSLAAETSRRFAGLAAETSRRFDGLAAETNGRFDGLAAEANGRFQVLTNDMHQQFEQVNRELGENRERMAKLEGALEGFLAGRRDRDAA